VALPLRRRILALAIPLLGLVGLLGRAAADATEPEAIRLVYRAPDYCPSVDGFVEEVRRSVPRLRVTYRDEAVRVFTVILEPGPRGRLTVSKDGVVVGSREVDGSTCEEVASVLAFAVALVVDPNAVPPPGPAKATPAPTSSGAPPPALPSALPAAAPPAPPAPAAPAPAGVLPRAVSSPRGEEQPSPATTQAQGVGITHVWWGLSAQALVAGALAPSATWGGGLAADVGGRLGALAPALRLGLDYATTAPVVVDGARVTLTNGILWIEGCPHAWQLATLTFRPCVRMDTGVRYAAAENIPGGHGVLRPWLDLGGMAHLRAGLGGSFFVDAGGGVVFAVTQDRVYLSPDITVYTVRLVGGRGELALGVEFR
jgi:hypothetical protein